jgi:hypothetical protein
MNPTVHGVRSPVKREGAERYVLISLVSFAASVICTRTFLAATGYPQLGGGGLHIAHVLWGGLLLFIASLLPLVLANRWAFNASAIISGVGVGLFIDEVGKFITQTNNYFYPPAAPIIYAFFLLTVLFYFQIRRPSRSTPRTELYHILEGMTEVLDHDLDPLEKAVLESRLLSISSENTDPNFQELTRALINYLEKSDLSIAPVKKNFFQRLGDKISYLIQKWVSEKRLHYFLVVACGAMGMYALIEFIALSWAILVPQSSVESVLTPLVVRGALHTAQDAIWFVARTILEGATGIALIISGAMFAIHRDERRGLRIAILSLVISLTVINLLVFYLDQFSAIITTLVQFFILLALTYYRRKYLHPR